MAKNRYSDFIEISPTFESVVDIDADSRNTNLWREYIVGEDMEKLMETLCQSLNNEGPDLRRSFWIEGTYGTGKSYAAIVVKHLMEEQPEVVDAYLSKNSRLSAYRNRFMKCRAKEKGDYLVIWKTGCTGIRDGNAMLMEAERAVREALAEKFGDKADYGESSLQEAVCQQVNSPMHNWEYILETTPLGDDYESVDDLRTAIKAGDLKALQRTAAIIRQLNWGLIDSLETFKKWITTVIDNNGLAKSGIFFLWDEFTEYVTNSDDQTVLQQLSEFTKVKPFYMLFVVHRTTEMVERITPERYQLITHRFHQVEFHISVDAAFDLIAGSIIIRTGMGEYWKEARKAVVKNIKPSLPDMSGLDDRISEQIDHFCPMHPMTIKLLSRVAENYAASQRTMFRFMKDQSTSDQGFVGYINKYGPDDQACWLTPEWLWDYFFTRDSDFSDKDTKASDYIRHYEENKHLVQNDDNALRVFKVAMLLLALMSTTKGVYSGSRGKDGIASTQDCLETCLAGVMNKGQVADYLATMQDSKILLLDKDTRGNIRLQLPFKGTSSTDFDAKFAQIDKKFSRYMMFSKDGAFAQEFEKQANDANDAMCKRMKIAVCCAETNSITNRLGEVMKELEKYPYKLGLLIVSVQSDSQAVSIQSTLQQKLADCAEPRLTIALLKTPFTDENRKKWITAITKQEMASDAGQTGSVQTYKRDAGLVVSTWVSTSIGGGKMIAYNRDQVFNNIYGAANLRNIIRSNVFFDLFPYAPERVVVTTTAYRTCNEGATLAGVQRKSPNRQMDSVMYGLKDMGALVCNSISEVENLNGSKESEALSALASLVRKEMESGHKVNLSDLWAKLQERPYGYYNSIACGILLAYVFSFYLNSKFTWTDSVQSPHVLAESTIAKMVSSLCTGKMTTDYLSAGSITWQNFSEYLAKIFNLTEGQVAEQTSGYHNVREAVTKSGAPFWALKYLSDEAWSSVDLRNTADKVIDSIQCFILQEGDIEGAMSEVLQLLQGRGKIRVVLAKNFQDKNTLSAAFRTFLFESSPALKSIATKLSVLPEELSDKLHSVMQGAIYTWTEEQVKEKLDAVSGEYRLLEAIGNVQGKVYHNVESAKKDLDNLFKFARIPSAAIEQLNKPWFETLMILYRVSQNGISQMDKDGLERDISALSQYGAFAKSCLSDGKSVLADLLSAKQIECTSEELSTIYNGLKDLSFTSSLTQFDKELNTQISRISFARNKMILQDTWRSITETNSVKEWCNKYGAPLLWILPKDSQKAVITLIDVQKGNHTVDTAVVSAINILNSMDTTILIDSEKVEDALANLIGQEYKETWQGNRNALLTEAKLKIGNDMSSWDVSDLITLQKIVKKTQQEIAKKEKLVSAKFSIKTMDERLLRDRVADFLDLHPEYCEDFVK